MLEQIRAIFFEYANAILLVPLYLAARHLKNNSTELKIIFYYLILSFITQAASFIFWKESINNFPILHAYTILEYLLLLWFYSVILKSFLSGYIFTGLAIVFPIFAVIDSVFIESIFAFNTYGRSLEALIFIFLSICWFVKIVAEDEKTREQGKVVNYINSGFHIYFSGSIALFAYSSYVEQMTITHRINVWTVHTILAVQLYILIAVGLWKVKTR